MHKPDTNPSLAQKFRIHDAFWWNQENYAYTLCTTLLP